VCRATREWADRIRGEGYSQMQEDAQKLSQSNALT
jgi:hypothetical protein